MISSLIPEIVGLKIESIKPDFSKTPEFDIPAVRALLPKSRERISFHLRNASCAVANGLRRTVCGELPAKFLQTSIENIETNEPFIKVAELVDRINYIKLSQDTPLDAVFALNVINNDASNEWKVVHSADLRVIESTAEQPFDHTYRLAELSPARHLAITRIWVVESRGYENAAACLTGDIHYAPTDYIPVWFADEKGNFNARRVKTIELIDLCRRLKVELPAHPELVLYQLRILLVPLKSVRIEPNRLRNFQIVIENPRSLEITHPNYTDQFLRSYQSTEYQAQHFALSFGTYGNVDAAKLVIVACDDIISRLQAISTGLASSDVSGSVVFSSDNVKSSLHIRGEDYTIGHLIRSAVLDLKPNIGLVNATVEHPLNRSIVINLIADDALGILTDALVLCVKQFEVIKTAIAKNKIDHSA